MLTRIEKSKRQVIVAAWERAVVVVDGKIARVEGEGRHRRRRREEWWVIDTRARRIVIPPQEVLTSDGLQVRVSLLVAFQVANASDWLTVTASPDSELHALAQIALRTAVSTRTLEELLASRDAIAAGLDSVRDAAIAFGADVTSFEVRDITLPQELRQAYASTALAKAEGAAKLERARAEAAAIRSLANTAQVLEAHPSLLQLRALESAGQIIVKIVPVGETEPA